MFFSPQDQHQVCGWWQQVVFIISYLITINIVIIILSIKYIQWFKLKYAIFKCFSLRINIIRFDIIYYFVQSIYPGM